jgi:hypothetical protein
MTAIEASVMSRPAVAVANRRLVSRQPLRGEVA